MTQLFFFFSSRRRHMRSLCDWSSDVFFFFSSRRRHTRSLCDWSSDVCSSDLKRNGTPVGTPTSTSFADTSLLPGFTYSYTVAARDAAGNVSPESASASATTIDTIAPSTPTGLVATAAGGSVVNLTWSASTDNIGVTGYIVKRNGAQGATPITTSHSCTGLSDATTYSYTLLASDAANNFSPESAIVSATTADATPPSVPKGLVA